MLVVKGVEVRDRPGFGIVLEARLEYLRKLVGQLYPRLHAEASVRVLTGVSRDGILYNLDALEIKATGILVVRF